MNGAPKHNRGPVSLGTKASCPVDEPLPPANSTTPSAPRAAPDFEQNEADHTQQSEPAWREPHVRLPNDLVARCLDKGKGSQAAVHLLAIRLHHGGAVPNYALNATFCRNQYAISDHAFYSGLHVLLGSQIIARTQPRPQAYAVEQLLPSMVQGYVALPVRQLSRIGTTIKGHRRALSDEVALIVAILLSPRVLTLKSACRRVGIVAANTRARLLTALRDVIDDGLIGTARGPNGQIWVGRPDAIDLLIGDVKIRPAKNHPAKKHGAHNLMKDSKDNRKRTQDSENSDTFSLLRRARERFREIDVGRVLAPHLLTQRGLDDLLPLLQRSAAAEDVIAERLGALNRDGTLAGKIKTWSYFQWAVDVAIEPEQLLVNGVEQPALQAGWRAKPMGDVPFIPSVEKSDDEAPPD